MRPFAKMTLIATAMGLMTAGSALAQPQAINVSVAPKFEKEARKLGEREINDQIADLTRQIERTLTRQEALDGAVINVVITDLKPNRPTFHQALDRPGLDMMRSLSIGGAAFEGTVVLPDGQSHDIKYEYYTPTLRDAFGSTVWTDASRAYSGLANNLANGRYVTR